MNTDTNQPDGASPRQNSQQTDQANHLRRLLDAHQDFVDAIEPIMAVVDADDKAAFLRTAESYLEDLWNMPTADQYVETPTGELAVQV